MEGQGCPKVKGTGAPKQPGGTRVPKSCGDQGVETVRVDKSAETVMRAKGAPTGVGGCKRVQKLWVQGYPKGSKQGCPNRVDKRDQT